MSQIELRIDGVVVYSSGAQPPAPTPPPAPPPAEPPPPPVITPGWRVVQNPLTVNPAPAGTVSGAPFDIRLARTYVFDCPANAIHSFRVVFASDTFRGNGAVLTTNQIVENPNRRNMWISEVPGGPPVDVSHWGNRHLVSQGNAENLALYVRFDAPVQGSVFVQKDQVYYLNVKPTYVNEPIRYLLQPYPMN